MGANTSNDFVSMLLLKNQQKTFYSNLTKRQRVMFLSKYTEMIKLRMFEAVDDDELEELKKILNSLRSRSSQSYFLKQTNKQGRLLLHAACYSGNYLVAQYLMEKMNDLEVSINLPDSQNYSAANLAMVRGYAAGVQIQDIDSIREIECIRFNEKVCSRRYLIIKALYNFGGDPLKYKLGENSPLHWACFHNDIEAIEFYSYQDRQRMENEYDAPRNRFVQVGPANKPALDDKLGIALTKNTNGLFPIDMVMKYVKPGQLQNARKILNSMLKAFREGLDREGGAGEKEIRKRLISYGLIDPNHKSTLDSYRKQTYNQSGKLEDLNTEKDPLTGITPEEHLPSSASPRRKVYVIEETSEYPTITISMRKRPKKLEEFYTHLLYWSIEVFDSGVDQNDQPDNNPKYFFYSLLMARVLLPFMPVINGKSCFHRACELGNINLVNFFLKSKFMLEGRGQLPVADFIDLTTESTDETPLHLAVMEMKYEVAGLLIANGADANLTDYRGWKPLELRISKEIKDLNKVWRKKFKKQLMSNSSFKDYEQLEEIIFVSYNSGYQYLIRAGKEKENIKDCIVYKQILRIEENAKREKLGGFEFFYVKSMESKNEYYIAIMVGSDLLAFYANLLKIDLFNRKQGFFDTFNISRSQDYERPRDSHIQRIILHILSIEFNIEQYMSLGIIKEHYPLHNLYKRKIMESEWSVVKIAWLSLMGVFYQGPQMIARINSAYYYFGQTLGYILAFSIVLTSFVYIFLVGYALFWGLFLYYKDNVQVQQIMIWLIVGVVWIVNLIIQIVWRRKTSELNYCWDIRKIETVRLLTEGKHEIDEITGEIVDMRVKSKILQYLSFEILIVVFLSLLPYIFNFYYITQFVESSEYESLVPSALLVYERYKIDLLAFVNAIYVAILSSIYKNIRSISTTIAVNFLFYFINYAGILLMITYYYDLSYFRPYFNVFVLTLMILHIAVVEISPIIIFTIKKAIFSRRWPKLRNKLIQQFKKSTVNTSDYSISEEAKLIAFKKRLIIQKQLEFNQRCIKSPVLIDDLMVVYFFFSYMFLFSLNGIGYYIVVFYFFIIIKSSMLIKRCLIYSKRPLACRAFDITEWVSFFELMTVLVPIHNILYLLLRDKRILELKELHSLSLQEADGTSIQDIYIFAACSHFTLIVYFLLNKTVQEKRGWVLKILEKEHTLKEKFNESIKIKNLKSHKLNKRNAGRNERVESDDSYLPELTKVRFNPSSIPASDENGKPLEEPLIRVNFFDNDDNDELILEDLKTFNINRMNLS